MKALRLHGPGEMRLHEEPVPVPGPGESLVRVTAVGICGSDLHWVADGRIGAKRAAEGLVLGHEFAGVVASGPRRGQHVAVDPAIPCEACRFCRQGKANLCTDLYFAGQGVEDGALREYVAWPDRCLFPLPDGVSDADGALLEPLGVALHSVALGRVRLGDTVGVFGCGPIGLLILQAARAAGAARLIATDVLPHRLAAAERLGATAFMASGGEEAKEILTATGGRGLDVTLEAAGERLAVEAAVAAAGAGTLVVLVGIQADDVTAFNASESRRKELSFQVIHRMRDTYPQAMDLARRGVVDLRSIVTARFPLEQAAEAFAVARRRDGLKVLIEPGG